MLNHLLLKFAMFFVGGVIFALFVIAMVPSLAGLDQRVNNQVLGTSTDNVVEDSSLKSWVQDIVGLVAGYISQSPALDPLVETSQSVGKAVTDVRTLPDAQKSAICQEICAPPVKTRKN